MKMRAGWNDGEINAPTLAGMVEDAGASAVAVHGRTAAQSYSGLGRLGLRRRGRRQRDAFRCSAAATASSPSRSSSVCGAGVKACSSAAACCGIRGSSRRPRDLLDGRPPREVTAEERGQFLLDYIDLLLDERVDEREGFRHVAPGRRRSRRARPRGRERWVINKLRALCAWYTKGLEGGSHLRIAINRRVDRRGARNRRTVLRGARVVRAHAVC